MKKLFLFLLVFVSTFLFSQTTNNVETSKSILDLIKTLVLPGLVGQIVVLLADAGKYIKSGEFSWSIFFTSKLRPFLLIQIISIIIIICYLYIPSFAVLFQAFTGYELSSLTALTLYGAATAILDGFLKKTI